LALRFDKLALRPSGLWIPELLEAKVLDSQGKLEKEGYRDYGIVIYSDGNPNGQMAETFVSQAEDLRLELPLIVSFRAMDYLHDYMSVYGIKPFLLDSQVGVIQGKRAQDKINSLDFKEDSGVCRLLCIEGGNWDAIRATLEASSDFGRIDWVCGKATRPSLELANELILERKYSSKIRKLEEQKKQKQKEFEKSLKDATKIF